MLGKIGAKFLPRVTRLFSKSGSDAAVKIAADMKSASKVGMTKSFVNAETGVETLERTFTLKDGKTITAKVDVFTKDGKKVSKLHIEGDVNDINRTKSIARESGNIFGGERVTIEKDASQWWQYQKKSTMVKDYSAKGQLEHKEYTLNINNRHKGVVVQDRVYDPIPIDPSRAGDKAYVEGVKANNRMTDLTSSTETMYRTPKKDPVTGKYDIPQSKFVDPNDNKYIQHRLTETCDLDTYQPRTTNSNNYHNFAQKGTKYENAVKAKEDAAKAAAEKAAAEKAAAEAAAKAAAEAEAAKLPRINLGRAGIDISQLKVAETTLADGSLQRIYTMPGSDKVVLKTVEKGILRQEWLYDTKFGDMVYLKQVGKGRPYILTKKGNTVQISGDRILGYKDSYTGKMATKRMDAMYYFDGKHSIAYGDAVRRNGGNVVGEIRTSYKNVPEYINGSETEKAWIVRDYAQQSRRFSNVDSKEYSIPMQNVPVAKSDIVTYWIGNNGGSCLGSHFAPEVVNDVVKTYHNPDLGKLVKPFEA